jgi:tyrosyl-tRNA synthetase
MTYWRLVTDADQREIADLERELSEPATNPMTLKKRLARRLVSLYHGPDSAELAEKGFVQQHSERGVPDDMPDFYRSQVEKAMTEGSMKPIVIDFIVASGMAETRSAARRLVDQRAVRVDQRVVGTWDEEIDPGTLHVIKVGRKMMRYNPQPGPA